MFNALKYSKDLETAGFSREQAEATIDVFFKFMDHNFATKEDLKSLKIDLLAANAVTKEELAVLRAEFVDLRHEVRSDIRQLEYRMTIKFGVMQAAGIAFLAALIKLF